ncbi:MAG: ATP-binding protein [Ignavibacteriaceae bacterium]|nr:ATP-binding protein [Ignavibacteriaceae bacterium]
MLRKFFQLFIGEKKYFSIVIVIILCIFLSALISPVLIDRIIKNWNNDLPSLIIKTESSSINLFKSKESSLVTKSLHLKNYIRENLEPQNFSYRSLIKLVNDKEFEDYSVEIIAPNGTIIAWNKKLALPSENVFPLSRPLGEDFFYTGDLTTYLCLVDSLHTENDNFYTIISSPVERHYSLQNQYYSTISLIKELSDSFLTEFNVIYNPFAEGTKDGRFFSFELLNNKNNKIGEVTFAKPMPDVTLKDIRDEISKFQSVLAALGIIFLTLGFREDFKKIRYNSIRLFIIMIYCVSIRVLFYIISFPSSILEGRIKDPACFSSAFAGGIVKSPVELFITSVLLLWFCLLLFKYIIQYTKSKKESNLNIKLILILLVPFIFFFLASIRGLNAAVKSIIFDSTLRYFKEPNLIPDAPTLLMELNLLIIGTALITILVSYLLLFLSYVPKESKSLKNILYLFLITQISGIIYIIIQSEPLITPVLSFLIISVLFILAYYIHLKKIDYVYNFLLAAIAGSLISITLLIHFNRELEKESLKTTAMEINRPNDNLLRFMITQTLMNASKNDDVITALLNKQSNYNSLAFRIWCQSTLQKESINSSISIMGPNQKVLASFQVGDISLSEIYSYGISNLTTGNPVIFEKNDEQKNTKIISGIAPVNNDGQIVGYVAALIEIDNQSIGSANIPDFLESQKNLVNTVIDPNQLMVLHLVDNKLVSVIGDVYPSIDQLAPLFKIIYSGDNEGWVRLNINGEDYLTYLLKENSNNEKSTAVLLKVKDISWNLFNFFKIFILHSIFMLIALTVIIFYRIKNIKYSFRTQLLLAFLLVSLIPILFLAVYNRQIVSQRSGEAIANELHERADYIERNINVRVNPDEEDLNHKFEQAGNELGITFSVYDESNEIYSSQEQYYSSGIFSKKLNPKIFYYLNYLSYREYITKENLDNFIYNSFYKKISVGGKNYILGVNDAFNKVKINFSAVEIDVFLFGIYSFAILIIIFLSTLLADRISFPIRNLTMAMSSVKQGDLNVNILGKEKGELKDLINGFNSMVGELKNNQNELAEFEREKAWKEMAKQVAHEIKNPLTPMKLSMQQLIISFKDKKANFEEIFEKLSATILSQIENLNQIASEFSRFARMPRINLEEVDLLSVIKDTAMLYADDKLNIEINSTLTLVKVEADIAQMRRLFINLIRNSIQASSTQIRFSILKENDNYMVYIDDNGKGIPPEYKNRIFEENFTTKTIGMGLGLKLTKKYLEDINGSIILVETSPNGTKFNIRIPAAFNLSS